jgi:hypothetical protein
MPSPKLALLAVLALLPACGGATPCPEQPAASAASAVSIPTELDHPSSPATHRAAAEDLLASLDMQTVLTTALDTTLKAQISAQPQLRRVEPVMRAFLEKYMSFEALRPDFSKLYQARFSELELRQMAAFYRSALGKRVQSEMPALMQQGALLGQERVREHTEELQQMLRQHLQKQGM